MKLEVGSNLWMAATVSAKNLEAEGIYSFKLKAANGEALPRFTPGSHIDVEVSPGLVRQYSLCNPPGQSSEYEIAVLLTEPSRGGSQGMHSLAVGQTMRISAPRNNFALVPTEGRSILVAGGVGITPVLSMAEELAAQSKEFELHFCSRSPNRTAFRQRLQNSQFSGSVRFYFDSEGQKLDLESLAKSRQAEDHLYVCGPTGFMDYVLGESERLGWEKGYLHKEYFSPPVVEHQAGGAFDVRLVSSGDVFHIPEDQSVVEVLAEHGIEIPTSCEQGICGTCITRVISGTIDHRDFILTDEEKKANNQFTPCCSRASCQLLELDL